VRRIRGEWAFEIHLSRVGPEHGLLT
jgi:hypothetical protein